MELKQKNKITILLSMVLVITLIVITTVSSYNYEYKNVTARVNVTNALPEMLSVIIDQDIVLNAGSTKTVSAIATVRDWNGYADIDNVNATFYYHENESGDPDHRNVHYTNSSCDVINQYDLYYADYNCTFDVYFFANPGQWFANVTANDTQGFSDSLENDTTINSLYALNVTDVIDYGELMVTETSPEDINATVTNFGNRDINVSVLGYGLVEGDGLGLICDLGTNITVENQRFSGEEGVDWDFKTPLSEVNQDLNITLLQPTHENDNVTWITKWQLHVPPNPFGICEGTVRFTATTS